MWRKKIRTNMAQGRRRNKNFRGNKGGGEATQRCELLRVVKEAVVTRVITLCHCAWRRRVCSQG